jgi:hypothetical protein
VSTLAPALPLPLASFTNTATVLLGSPSLAAMARVLSPSDTSAATACACPSAVRGLPNRTPLALALAMPATTLSRISSRSNCAMAQRMLMLECGRWVARGGVYALARHDQRHLVGG